MAGVTGFEPATSGVTGRRSNQLSYTPERNNYLIRDSPIRVKHLSLEKKKKKKKRQKRENDSVLW